MSTLREAEENLCIAGGGFGQHLGMFIPAGCQGAEYPWQ